MAEGATRTKILTRTVPFVGSSLAYYNGGIDAIVLQLKETGGGGASVLRLPVPWLLKRKQNRTGRAVYEQAKADKRRPTGE